MHENSLLIFARHAVPYIKSDDVVLEVGPEHGGSNLVAAASHNRSLWTTLDIEARTGVDVVAQNDSSFPLSSDCFDVVISANVAEHVRQPWRWFAELKRVCKPKGIIITITPVSWPYHAVPIDCWRIYPDGMRGIADELQLEMVETDFVTYEAPATAWRIPGHTWPRWRRTVFGFLRLPIQCAYDTYAIMRKR